MKQSSSLPVTIESGGDKGKLKLRASKPKATLASVAKALGVSRTTVSNAFNRPDQLSESLRTMILEQAKALGYFGPDPMARAMRSRELREVGVVFHHDLTYAMSDPSTIEFLRGVATELDKYQLVMQVIPKMGRKLMLQAAFQATSDVLIIHTEIGPEFVPELLGVQKPFVLVDSCLDGMPSLCVDDRQGAVLAMQHVLASRPDKVLVLCFHMSEEERQRLLREPTPGISNFVGTERMVGYLLAARQAGFDEQNLIWVEVDDQFPESAADRLREIHRTLLKSNERVAIVAMSDRMALNAMEVAKSWDDIKLVAVVGFDDIPAAESAGLTTIRQDLFRKGQLAVEMLLNRSSELHRRLGVELVVRST